MKKTTRMLTLGLLAGAVVATSGHAYADNDRDGPRGGMMRVLMQIDSNDDGAFALEEMTAFISERFATADTDSNAQLTAEEVAEAMPGRRGGERAGTRLMERVDINADGAITLAEVNERATKLFVLMDIDNSGVVEADELPNRGEGRRGRR